MDRAHTVRVRYFAAAESCAGRAEELLTLDDATLRGLSAVLVDRYGDPMARVLRTGSFLLDDVVTRDLAQRIDHGVVDVLPPPSPADDRVSHTAQTACSPGPSRVGSVEILPTVIRNAARIP